jgi:hypothetical protein
VRKFPQIKKATDTTLSQPSAKLHFRILLIHFARPKILDFRHTLSYTLWYSYYTLLPVHLSRIFVVFRHTLSYTFGTLSYTKASPKILDFRHTLSYSLSYIYYTLLSVHSTRIILHTKLHFRYTFLHFCKSN